MAATQTTAGFQIMQDAGKENPRNMIKEKTMMAGKSASNILQPLGASSLGVGGVSMKQGRANFAVLNSNANVRTAAAVAVHNNNNNNIHGVHTGVAGSKVVSFSKLRSGSHGEDITKKYPLHRSDHETYILLVLFFFFFLKGTI